MKKIITALALSVAMISPAMADRAEFCKAATYMAEAIMNNRQSGVSVIDMMEIANNSQSNKKLLTSLITEAYAEPLYQTDEYKQKAATEFAAQQYLMCLKAGD